MSQMSFFEGNASNSKKRRMQSQYWKCNYHLKEGEDPLHKYELIESIFRPLCLKYVFGEEYGSTNSSPHLEGYLIFLKKTEFTSIQKLFKFSDLQASRKKNAEAGIAYCLKEGNTSIQHGMPKALKKLACEGNLYCWQSEIIDIIRGDPCDRTIYWFRGSKGNEGKTTFCKYLVRFHDAIISGGKATDMKHQIAEYLRANGNTPELICMNIPKSFDSEYLSYHGIEEVKDMLFNSGKYEGKMVDGNPPHLLIFSNIFPQLEKCNIDRWQIYDIGKNAWHKGGPLPDDSEEEW